jgi:hypothetical protein
MSEKCFAASFNGKPKAAAFHGYGYAFGSPLNEMFQTFTSTTSQKHGGVQLGVSWKVDLVLHELTMHWNVLNTANWHLRLKQVVIISMNASQTKCVPSTLSIQLAWLLIFPFRVMLIEDGRSPACLSIRTQVTCGLSSTRVNSTQAAFWRFGRILTI